MDCVLFWKEREENQGLFILILKGQRWTSSFACLELFDLLWNIKYWWQRCSLKGSQRRAVQLYLKMKERSNPKVTRKKINCKIFRFFRVESHNRWFSPFYFEKPPSKSFLKWNKNWYGNVTHLMQPFLSSQTLPSGHVLAVHPFLECQTWSCGQSRWESITADVVKWKTLAQRVEKIINFPNFLDTAIGTCVWCPEMNSFPSLRKFIESSGNEAAFYVQCRSLSWETFQTRFTFEWIILRLGNNTLEFVEKVPFDGCWTFVVCQNFLHGFIWHGKSRMRVRGHVPVLSTENMWRRVVTNSQRTAESEYTFV